MCLNHAGGQARPALLGRRDSKLQKFEFDFAGRPGVYGPMPKFRIVIFAWLAAVSGALSALAEPPKLIVSILVDQLRYDYLERFHDQFAKGGFRLLTDKGSFMTFAHYDYCPTVTGPGHATFLSGSDPCQTGIIANDWFDRVTRKTVYCVEDPSVQGVGIAPSKARMSPRNFIGGTFADELRLRFHGKVVAMSMKDRGAVLPAGKKPTGAFWFDAASGKFVTSSYYMKELPEWVRRFNDRGLPAQFHGRVWDRLLPEQAYDYPDVARGEDMLTGETNAVFPHKIVPAKNRSLDSILPTPFGNQVLLELAEAAMEGEKLGQGPGPDLLSVSFSSVDAGGHKFGPYSQEVQDIVLRLDGQLEALFKLVDKKVGLSRVIIVLTADHGVAPNPEFAQDQGMDGLRLSESNLLADLKVKLNAKFSDRFGAGDYLLTNKFFEGNLFLNREALGKSGIAPAEVSACIRDWALGTGKFAAAFSREELLEGRAPGELGRLVFNAYNPERSADMILIQKPYSIYGGKSGTTHGTPYAYDTHVPVLLFGAPFRPGRYAGEFYVKDIVPTLCAALGMNEPAGCMGKPFVRILRSE